MKKAFSFLIYGYNKSMLNLNFISKNYLKSSYFIRFLCTENRKEYESQKE